MRLPEIGVIDRHGPLPLDCLSNVLDGNRMLPHLAGDDADQMQGIGMLRLDGEDLPINLLGRLQPPRLMVLDCNASASGIVAMTQSYA